MRSVADFCLEPTNNGTMRKEDSEQPSQFRVKDRIYSLNGQWYFQTREDDHGPYPTRAAAQQSLDRYVAEMSDLNDLIKPPAPQPDLDLDVYWPEKPS